MEVGEDILQDACYAAARYIHTFDPSRGTLEDWFGGIVVRCRGHWGAVSNRMSEVFYGVVPIDWAFGRLGNQRYLAASKLANCEKNGRVDYFGEVIDELPPVQRRMVELRYFCQMTMPEISTEMAIPLGTLKTKMTLVRRSMKVTLEADGIRY